MREAACVFDVSGNVLLWHVPNGRSGGAIPDSRDLWEVLWENRESLGGVAHTHPWTGTPVPSTTDITTWEAIERGLGRRLLWPIVTMSEVRCFVYDTLGELGCVHPNLWGSMLLPETIDELLRLSTEG